MWTWPKKSGNPEYIPLKQGGVHVFPYDVRRFLRLVYTADLATDHGVLVDLLLPPKPRQVILPQA